jgi:hypothetical protein
LENKDINIMDKMQEILSDPESLQQIQELANMLNSETQNTSTQEPPPTDTPNDAFDIAKMLQLAQLFNSTSNSQDATLLLAIKPYLTNERQGKVDKAIKLMKAYDIFTTAKNSGLLNQLDNLI